MYNTACVIALTVLLGTSASQVIADPLVSCIFKNHDSAIAEIEYKVDGSGVSQGTGFLVSSDGYIITAEHVLHPPGDPTAAGTNPSVQVRLGSIVAQPTAASIISRDVDSDVALLKIPVIGSLPTPLPLGTSSGLDVGTTLIAAGFPKSDLSIATPSEITSRNTIVRGQLKPYWQTSLALNEVNSGGPVFGPQGTVVGIAEAIRDDDAQLISFVTPIQFATGLLKESGASGAGGGPCNEDLLTQPLRSLQLEVNRLWDSLPTQSDFDLISIPSADQQVKASCPQGEILVAAFCTNANRSQTAVGPIITDENGVRSANCFRYGPVRQAAEGQLICMKVHPRP